MLLTILYIVFFGVYGIKSFVPFKYHEFILGAVAIIIAIVTIIGAK